MAEIMRIELTRMCCAAEVVFPDRSEPLPALPVDRDVDESEPLAAVEVRGFEPLPGIESVVPVTSMRCPLWLFSSLSCPSRMYEVVPPDGVLVLVFFRPLAAVPLVLPVVAVAELDADPPE